MNRWPRAAEHVAGLQPDIRTLAQTKKQRFVYLGSGPLEGLAHESALKMLELTAGEVVTYFDSPLGFRHGPKSALDGDTLAVVYVSTDPYTRRYDLDIVAEIRAQLGEDAVTVISAEPIPETHGPAVVLPGSTVSTTPWSPCRIWLFAQYLALFTALEHGKTPDNPFPSGEVNRVVQGVTIYPMTDEAERVDDGPLSRGRRRRLEDGSGAHRRRGHCHRPRHRADVLLLQRRLRGRGKVSRAGCYGHLQPGRDRDRPISTRRSSAFPATARPAATSSNSTPSPRGVLGHDRYSCDNDMVCGWAGSLAGEDGINVISGTGSMTYGERQGVGHRVGGWGELFGDEGSAYWIAAQGLNAFSRMSDGRHAARPAARDAQGPPAGGR